MTDFKSLKPTMYCTPMAVRSLYAVFERKVDDDEGGVTVEQDVTDSTIEQHINHADSIVLGYLVGPYGEGGLSVTDPYFLGPVSPSDNPSTIRLNGVVVASTAITEQWFVNFTADDAYSVTGSVSGAQGTGTIDSDFTSTNSDIQIMAEDWVLGDDTVAIAGNQIIFATCISHRLVYAISAKLACADLISSYYQTMKGEDPEYAKQLRRQAMDILKALVDVNSDVSLSATTSEDISSYEAVSWSIDKNGSDATTYGDFDDDYSPMDL